MKSLKLLIACFSLWLSTLSGLAQPSTIIAPDTTQQYKPVVTGLMRIASMANGQKYILERNKPAFKFQLDTNSIVGLKNRLAALQDRFRETIQPLAVSTIRANTNNLLPAVLSMYDGQAAGLFQRDDADPGAVDNGVTIIRTAGGVVYKRIAYDFVNGAWTLKGDAVSDDTGNFYKLFSLMGKSRVIYIPPGYYRFSYNIQVPPDVQLIIDPAATFRPLGEYPPTTVRGNNGRYIFVPESGCRISGGIFDLRDQTMGGINIIQVNNVKVENCIIHGWRGATFGVGVAGGDQNEITGCIIFNGDHGINVYASNRTLVSHCIINQCFSGIYGAVTERLKVTFCIVTNVQDVAYDSEHGRYNFFQNNFAEGAKQGEYTLYSGGADGNGRGTMHDLRFDNNHAHRVAQYIISYDTNGNPVYDGTNPEAGAFTIHSLDTAAYNVGFVGNSALVEFGYVFATAPMLEKSNRLVLYKDNIGLTQNGGKFFNVLNSDGLLFAGNWFEDLGGGEATENQFRDAHRATFADNWMIYRTPKTTGFALLFNSIGVETSPGVRVPWISTRSIVARNHFVGCDDLAIKVDMFASSAYGPIVENNDLGGYSTTGGLTVTANGDIRAVNQRLKIRLPSGTTNINVASALSRSGASKASGDLGFGRADYNGLGAWVFYVRGSGVFAQPVNTINGLTVSTSGDNITLTNGTGVTTYGYLDLELNSY